jgi:hypothetical protein
MTLKLTVDDVSGPWRRIAANPPATFLPMSTRCAKAMQRLQQPFCGIKKPVLIVHMSSASWNAEA